MMVRENGGPVAKTSRGPTTSTSKHDRPVVRTSGEIFGDGSIIELVSPATDRHLQLLFWHKQQKKVAQQIEYRGRFYKVPDADETLLQAIRFPGDALDYGTAQKLFTGLVKLSRATSGSRLPKLRSLRPGAPAPVSRNARRVHPRS